MKAGSLRHRVELQKATYAQDGVGEPIETWATYAKRWAAVEPLSGRELLQAQQVNSEATIRVRLRFVSGVTQQQRLLHNSRTLEIVSVIDPQERNAELELLCKEGT